jgi:hypothetical protein
MIHLLEHSTRYKATMKDRFQVLVSQSLQVQVVLTMLLLPAVLLLAQAQAQAQAQEEATQIFACDLLYNCTSCLADGLGCVFAVGECTEECVQGSLGATCYSAASHPELDTNGICNLYETDNLQCQAQTSCEACLNTLKSDLQSCQWYPAALGNSGACFGGGVGPFGAGQVTCSLDMDSTTEAPSALGSLQTTMTPTSAAPTETPTTVALTTTPTIAPTIDAELVCRAASSDCQSCLEIHCAWFPNVPLCAPNCSSLADGDCFSISATDANLVTQTCLVASTAAADRERCFAKDNCEACLATTQTNGSTCQWYTYQDLSWCSTGDCDANGVCGKTTCDIIVNATTLEPTYDNPTTTTINPTTSSDTAITAVPNGPCSKFNVVNGCSPCLSSPDNCAWSVDTCLSSCDNIADAPCLSVDSPEFNGSVPDMCYLAMVQAQEDLTCRRKKYCTTCTATFLSNGMDKCSWYQDGANEWCGRGGCNSNGICGSSNQSTCPQVPTDPPFTSVPAIDFTFPPSSTESGSKAEMQPWMGIWTLAVTMLVIGEALVG